FFRAYLCSGVTAVFDVGGYPWTVAFKKRAEDDRRGPHLAAGGPPLSPLDFWLELSGGEQVLYLRGAAVRGAGVRFLPSLGTDAAKAWFIPRGRSIEEMAPIVRAIEDEAQRIKLPVIVHATTLREAKEALRGPVHLLVHGVFDAPVDDEFLQLARSRGVL